MQPTLDLLRSSPGALTTVVAILGLLIGSFLNVVALRLPRMMEAQWKRESRAILEIAGEDESEALSLWSPPSRCPQCKARIKPWHNIPVLSWILLRGRCAACKAPVSIQYPLVEFSSGLASAVCAWHFGWSPQLAAALILSWSLLALTVIDLRDQLLPDDITLPLMWVGLGLSVFEVFVDSHSAIWGAIAGYMSLWTIYQLFRLLTGKEGMGYGDFKLLAALGAWFGAGALPMIILLSSAVGAVIGIVQIVALGRGRGQPAAFGPYLAGAGWITLVWGDALRDAFSP